MIEEKSNQMPCEGADKQNVRKPKKWNKHSNSDRRDVSGGTKPNDVSWYAQSEQLLKDAASLAFSNPQGVRVDFEHIKLGSYPIHILELGSAIGKADEASDPATVAARQIYSFVRHANSGSANYEAPDLFMYILALGELYAVHGWLTRIYGTLRHFNGMNRAIPKALIESFGVDYDDIILHIADLRLFINLTARKLNSFYVPANLPYFKRKFFVYSQVFTDTPESKADIFLFNPSFILKFDGSTDPNGSRLVKEMWPQFGATTRLTFNQIVTKVNSLFDGLMAEEDINIMSGDILKAYGRNVVQIAEITEDYTIVPQFSGEMLAQYHNASILSGVLGGDASFDVYQDTTGVIHQDRTLAYSTAGVNYGYTNKPFDFPQLLDADADTSPAYVMEATRLKAVTETSVTETEERYRIIDCGTEVVLGSYILFLLPNTTAPLAKADTVFAVRESEAGTSSLIATTVERMSRFHLHPIIYEVNASSDYNVRVYGEINNFTVIEPSTLYKINTVAIMSLLGVSSGPSVLAANPK